MAVKKFEKGSEEWKIFTDFWELCQRHWEPEETEEYWQTVIDDIDTFYRNHKTLFSRKLCIALIHGLEEKAKVKNVQNQKKKPS